jgi:hypothetical protein
MLVPGRYLEDDRAFKRQSYKVVFSFLQYSPGFKLGAMNHGTLIKPF